MSGTRSPQSGLTRRGFLKATGAAAGALGLAGAAGMTTADSWLAPTQAHAEPEERVGYTFWGIRSTIATASATAI